MTPEEEKGHFDEVLDIAIDESAKLMKENPHFDTADIARATLSKYTGVLVHRTRADEQETLPLPPIEQFIEPLSQFSTRSPCPKCNTTDARALYCDGVKRWFGAGCCHDVRVKGEHITRRCRTCSFSWIEDVVRPRSEHDNLKILLRNDLIKLSKMLDLEEGVVDDRAEDVFVDVNAARELALNLVGYINMLR